MAMGRIALLLLISLISSGFQSFSTFLATAQQSTCELTNGKSNKGWLRAPSARSGLCNQLLGVLSWAPVATLFNLNLIVGDMYSRSSFQEEFRVVAKTAFPVPFSHFFNWTHYTTSIQLNNAAIDYVVEEKDLRERCGQALIDQKTTVVPKRFWPFTQNDLLQLLVTNNITLPRPPGSILQLGPDLLTTYQFRNFPTRAYQHYQLASLSKLNGTLQVIFDAIVSNLPKSFIAVHLRLEHDMVSAEWAERNHTHFKGLIQSYLVQVRRLIHEQNGGNSSSNSSGGGGSSGGGEAPARSAYLVYLSTGLFHKGPAEFSKDPHLSFRPATVLHEFQAEGFLPVWNTRVLSEDFVRSIEGTAVDASRLERLRIASALLDTIGAEQRALVDLFICKAASGFVSAHVGSSFTYLAHRWRGIDRGVPDSLVESKLVGDPSRIFSSWGFRH